MPNVTRPTTRIKPAFFTRISIQYNRGSYFFSGDIPMPQVPATQVSIALLGHPSRAAGPCSVTKGLKLPAYAVGLPN